MGECCVSGCGDIAMDEENKKFTLAGKEFHEGDFILSLIHISFFYLPILVTMIFSFNSSKSLTRFTGFSLRWYEELLGNGEVIKAVYVSVTIAIIATIVSTILGTITAIGLSKSKKVIKELLLSINNIPILNPEIVTAISLMLLFSSLGFRKGRCV